MLMLVVLIIAAILLPIIWANKTYHEMHDIGWAGNQTESRPWGLIIVGSVITIALLAATN